MPTHQNHSLGAVVAAAAATTMSKLVFVQHLEKAGGTMLCDAFCHAAASASTSQCSQQHCENNCALSASSNRSGAWAVERWSAAADAPWDSADLSVDGGRRASLELFAPLCGIVMHEPGHAIMHASPGDTVRSITQRVWNASLPWLTPDCCHGWWSTFVTVIIVRHPWDRFLSYIRMLVSFSRTHASGIFNSLRSIEWRNVSAIGQLLEVLDEVPHSLLQLAHSNYLLAHLVGQMDVKAGMIEVHCNAQTLSKANWTLKRYDVVLNPVDLPEASARAALALLPRPFGKRVMMAIEAGHGAHGGTSSNSSRSHVGVHYARPSADSEAERAVWSRFRELNQCDFSLYEHANAILSRYAP